MVYVEYAKLLDKINKTLKKLNRLIDEEERLFSKTQPQSFDCSKEKTKGGLQLDINDKYLIPMEEKEINEKKEKTKKILMERQEQLEQLKQQLLISEDIYDKIYVAYYIKHSQVKVICREVGYGKSQFYVKLKEIKKNIKKSKNRTKSEKNGKIMC